MSSTIVFFGVVILVAGLVSTIRPIPWLLLPTRGRAALAMFGGLVLLTAGAGNDPVTPSTEPARTTALQLASNERLISRVDYGEDWPFTVEDGVLSCDLSAVVFTTGGVSYGVNGRASGVGGYAELAPIWREDPFPIPDEILTTIPEAKRRQLFADIVACEDNANEAAEALSVDLTAQYDEASRLSNSCKEALREGAGLTEDEFDLVSTEGLLLSWPPLTPTRINVGQIIQDGLALCE